MKLFSTLIISLVIFTSLSAQQDYRIATGATSLKFVEQISLPEQDNEALLKAEIEHRGPGIAPRFAVNMEVNINTETHGNWESLPNGNELWRLSIYSAGAKSLNLGFTKYFMPEGASMILYSADKLNAIGPFTPADNEVHEQLWTPILEGDELVIEVQIPAEKVPELQLELRYINHDFLGFGTMMNELKSGSCNLDVICGLADGYPQIDEHRDIIQSVAVIGLNGGTFCTGFLVNNARQDCTPFFMTAFHCGINASNAATFVAYWNFQNSTCRPPFSAASGGAGDGQLTDFNTGAVFRSGNAPTDFTLIELDDPVSETANAYFAGWTATGNTPQSAVCVHHPSTDEKRITFDYDPVEADSWSGSVQDHWYPEWDLGVTEPGSSGSPLFDQNERVIGQLHGGPSSCTSSDVHDLYGMFHLSWTGGGTPSTRLRDWLDPDNTGILVMDGRWQFQCSFYVEALNTETYICSGPDAQIPIVVGPAFEGPVDITISTIISGFPFSVTINDIPPGDTAIWTLMNTALIPAGDYTISLTASDGTNEATSEMIVHVSNNAPGSATLISPAPNAVAQPLTIQFDWSANGSLYQLQVATDIGFTTLVTDQSGLTENSYTGNYNSATTYFWRVKSTNACGTGPWSSGQQFTTSQVLCNTYNSIDIPQTISPTGQFTVTSSLEYTGPGIITDVNVLNITGTHTWLADLNFSITSPSGTTVDLVGNICGDLDDFNISFDDEATGTIPCPYTDGNTYPPSGNLSDFIGETAQGIWTLTVFDDADVDGGILSSWGLELCLSGVSDANINIEEEQITLCQGETTNIQVYAGADFTVPVQMNISGLPANTTAYFEPNPVPPGSSTVLSIINDPSTPTGSYSVQVSGSDGVNSSDDTFSFDVLGAVNAINLVTPLNSTVDQSLFTTFNWSADPNASQYQIEVATDVNFANIVFQNGALNGTTTATTLSGLTTYYWRVRGSNICGEGDWSAIFSFTTEAVFCNEYSSSEVPLIISDGPPVVTVISTLNVPAGGNILDLNVAGLVGTHTYLGDLRILLTSPAGTTVALVDGICGTNEDFNISFDDEATLDPPCPYNDGGTYLPDEDLSAFDGELATGTWTLTVLDQANIDGGSLDGWGLVICMNDYDDYSVIASPGSLIVCDNTPATTLVQVGTDYANSGVNLTLSNIPPGLTPTLGATQIDPGSSTALTIQNTGASPGNYNITLTANDGSQSTFINIPIQVIVLPANINITAPLNNATGVSQNPVLNWADVPGISSYNIVVATDANFTDIIYDESVNISSFEITTSLNNGTTYYWEVSIENVCGEITSGVLQFTTIADLALNANPMELNICEGENATIVLTIGLGFGPNGAQITANNPAGTTVNYTQNPVPNGASTVISVVGLPAGLSQITYTATGSNGSNAVNITYNVDNGPAAVTLQSPPNSATGISLSPNFIWNNVSDATSYEFILASDAALNNIIFQGTLTGTAFNYSGPLESGTTYYWTVIANNECTGTMSAVYQFNTQTVSVQNVSSVPDFQVVPNPATEWAIVIFEDGLHGDGILTCWNASGQKVEENAVNTGIQNYRFDLSKYPAGVYLVQLILDGKTAFRKLVVAK